MLPNVFASHDLDELARHLRCKLNESEFSRQIVVVPSPQVKQYLLWQFSDAAGFKFYSVSGAIDLILRTLKKYPRFPSSTLLGLHIESELKEDPDLAFYIQGKKHRLRHLADHLSQLFMRYNKLPKAELDKWKKSDHWQAKLYRRIFSMWDEPSTYLTTLKLPEAAPIEMAIHLFAPFDLTPAQITFFEKVARILPVYYDFYSPSEVYWGDAESEDNSLISHFGRLGKRLFNIFLDRNYFLDESYPEIKGETLLKQVKRDLLALEAGSYPEKDASIQLHRMPSRLREVEVLEMVLMNLMEEDPSLRPSDVVIMAPDIATYLPHIELVFGRDESPFSYDVSDLPRLARSQGLAAFHQLLSMADRPFTPDYVHKLFSFGPVKKQLDLSDEDLLTFEKWMRDILFGFDTGDRGSFKAAFDDLLLGLATSDPTLDLVDLTDAELLGRFIKLITELQEHLTDLKKEERTCLDWADLLEELSKTYLGEESAIAEVVQTLRQSDLTATFDFETIRGLMDRAFSRKSASIKSGEKESLRFSSLKAGRAHPARVIYLMGMEEGRFPGKDKPSSFSAFQITPTLTDEDRYLFLQIISSAKDHLIFSAIDSCPKDNKPLAPCLLIQELFSYLDEKDELTHHHPAFAFHRSHYAKESELCNFSLSDYQKALHYYTGKKPFSHAPITHEIPHQSVVDVRQLQKLARHPLQFYINETLGVFLPFDEKREDREFILSALEKARLKRSALHAPPSDKKLPLGVFKEVATHRLQTEIAEQEQILHENGIDKLFSLELSPDAESLEVVSETLWRTAAPRLLLPEEVMVVGTITALSKEGLLFFGKNTSADLAKAWPLYLLIDHLDLPIKKQILFLKSGEAVAPPVSENALADYLRYYQEARRAPSLRMPDWIEALETEDPDVLKRAIDRSLKNTLFPDPYLQWIHKSLEINA